MCSVLKFTVKIALCPVTGIIKLLFRQYTQYRYNAAKYHFTVCSICHVKIVANGISKILFYFKPSESFFYCYFIYLKLQTILAQRYRSKISLSSSSLIFSNYCGADATAIFCLQFLGTTVEGMEREYFLGNPS